MLTFKNVTKRFGGIVALEDVSFEIQEGEFVCVIGPSGAGKTTLMKLLIHEYSPDEGEIIMGDIAIHKLRSREVPKLRQSLGIVFQDFKLLPHRTIYENIETALAVKKVAKDEWKDRIAHVLTLVGLVERANLFPSQLSGGELQRAAIARAIVVNPVLIFADEPTGNLDWETGETIMKILSRINEEGKTVIVTTHNQDLIEKYGKRILEMKGGRLARDTGTPKAKEKEKEPKKHEHTS